MPLVVPTDGQIISVASFGKPITDEVNRLTALSAKYPNFVYRKDNLQSSTLNQMNITFPVKIVDTGNPTALFNGTSFVVPAGMAGIWQFVATVVFSAVNSQPANAAIAHNSWGNIGWGQGGAINSVPTTLNVSAVLPLAVGDTITVTTYSNVAGVPIGGTWPSWFMGALVAPQ